MAGNTTANNPGFDPNLGVLSAFEGVGNAITDVGKIGLVDALETRRSKMENELRAQLKGDDQAFAADQADLANTQKVDAATVKSGRDEDAATVKFGRDKELQKIKNAGVRGKNSNAKNEGIYQKAGATITAGDMTDRYEAFFELNNDAFVMPEGGIPTQDEWAKKEGWTIVGTKPPVPPTLKGIDEETARKRILELYPDASEEDVNQFIEEMGKEALIVKSQMPGIMDSVAADANGAGNGQFGGGVPQGSPAPSAPASTPEPTQAPAGVDYQAASIAGADENTADSIVRKKQLVGELMKYKASDPAKSVARRSSRAQTRSNSKKIQKAAKQVEAALKKGNIKTVSKDSLKLALKNSTFVNGLDETQLQQLLDYLGE